VLEAAKEKVEAIEDTHETLIAHRNNEQLRVLTVISVILLPLSVITGFFGMNVHFPGTGTVAGFVTSVAVLVGCFVGLIAWFRVRGWL
jgi:magnesium transporter